MFKIGEKLICINNISSTKNIIVGNIYIAKKCTKRRDKEFVTIIGEEYEEDYFCYRFKSVTEIRKDKLEKLKNV